MTNNRICIIPIRSKSKGLVNKNIKKIDGIPLICFALNSCIESKKFKKIYVATESLKYIKYIKNLLKKKSSVIFFRRSPSNSKDNSQTEEVISEIIKKENIKNVDCALVQATSPLLIKKDIIEAFKIFDKGIYDTLFSSYKSKRFFWKQKKEKLIPINYSLKNRAMRQNHRKTIVENGAIYIFNSEKFKKFKIRLHDKIGTCYMPEKRSIEIDDRNDINEMKNFLKVNRIFKQAVKQNFKI